VLRVEPHGNRVLDVVYRTPDGHVDSVLLYAEDAVRVQPVTGGGRLALDADPVLFRLAAEAKRLRLAHLFDSHLAVHTSLLEPLPHQITAVYGEMLVRQPLRYLLADDPGAGKTIMAGLLIKELILRDDVHRCLIVCPGSLAEQWQDGLRDRFGLGFEILTNDRVAAARTRHIFAEIPFLIARLDKVSRNDGLQAKLREADWDLVIVDEAHKMSASYFGYEVKGTKRYKLGKLLSSRTRHFLLLTATPHDGKKGDFQLFMALLDGDGFEGRFWTEFTPRMSPT
jgi:SNF2 family DNA or RNA helicase